MKTFAMLVVIMGVSGSGKTTIGKALAKRLGIDFADGDDYHSQANKEKMAAAIALSDADRLPWLQELNKLLLSYQRDDRGLVLACSCLKKNYRKQLSSGLEAVRFVYLKLSQEEATKRLAGRKDHFFNPALIKSQFETLQEPGEEEALIIESRGDSAHCLEGIIDRLEKLVPR